jgi:hypothetical protein
VSNFNKVFLAIKNRCESQKRLAEISCFEAVAEDAGVPINKLPMYLSHLQDIGLIKYSIREKYIYLTALGKKQESLAVEKTV